MTQRVGIYARTSRAEKDDPSSILVQLANCREKATDEGWKVVDEYVDAGISGWRRKLRPSYERLIADARSGRIDAVLCRDYERLLRNDREGQRWLDLYEARGFHDFRFTLEADIDLRRARDRKDWKERVAGAVYYSDRLSERVRRAKQARKAAGVFTGGGRAFGYEFTPDGLAVEPAEANVIHDAVKRLARHESLYRITLDWNAAGLRTAGGGRWRPANMRRMLTGAHLTGGNGYPRILSDVEASIVRQALSEEEPLRPDSGGVDSRGRRIGARGRPGGRRYPARGLVVCSECGEKLTTGAGAYRCSVSHGGCGRVSIKADELERYLLERWVAFALEARAVGRLVPPEKSDSAPGSGAPRRFLAELRDVSRRLEQVAAGLADGTLTVGVAGAATRMLEKRRRTLTDELARSLPKPEVSPHVRVEVDRLEDGTPYIVRAGLTLEPGSEAERIHLRELLTGDIERVTIAPGAQRGKAFEPERVAIAWR